MRFRRPASLPLTLPLLLLPALLSVVAVARTSPSPVRPTPAAENGAIAYTRDYRELRLIEPDGTKDRLIWTAPKATKEMGLKWVAWRPDGREIAISSSHDAAVSLYDADLYGIKPDGTGLRRITNPPDRSQYGRYPKGTVTLTVRNSQTFVRDPQAKTEIFIVYVAGAPKSQMITLPVGVSKTLVFKNVVDFGAVAQGAVAIFGHYRWSAPGADVQAGKSVTAVSLTISGDGVDFYGAYRPSWRADGSRISYRNGLCLINNVPANPRPGEVVYKPMFAGKHPLGACTWDWGPMSALDQVLYTENASGGGSHIYRIKEGGQHPGTKLTTFTDIDYQLLLGLHWLPDGSGFLFANKTLFDDRSNIFRYDFATKKVSQVTQFEKEFARDFSISPDGKWIVFEHGASSDDDTPADLWIVGIDGSDPRLLVRNGLRPSWGRATSTSP